MATRKMFPFDDVIMPRYVSVRYQAGARAVGIELEVSGWDVAACSHGPVHLSHYVYETTIMKNRYLRYDN